MPGKVLIISRPFPPSGGSGVQRTSKYVKYLPEFGWTPIVLTANKPLLPEFIDNSLLKDISKSAKIIKTPSLELENRQRKTLISKAWIKILRTICIPDTSIVWMPHALYFGTRILKKESVKLIYATGNPFSSFLIAIILKRVFKKPLVLDFRDPWTLDPFVMNHKSKIRILIERIMEKVSIENAARVVLATDGMLTDFLKEYSNMMEKFSVITNGFDEDDFQTMQSRPILENNEFKIVYTGLFNPNRRPDNFFYALKLFIDRSINPKLKIILVGPENDIAATKMIKNLSLENYVSFTGYVSHEKAIYYLKNADLLLLIVGKSDRSQFIMTGKIYEYLAARKPILAIAPPDGDAGQLILNIGAGYVINEEKIDVISLIIEKLYNEHINGGIQKIHNADLTCYTRKTKTAQLANLFDEIISHS